MKLSDYVMNFLEEKTDSIFLVSGGGAMHIVDSIGESNLDSYCCHHEQACALAAETYSRINNDKIGVASVTSGPGATNAITGVSAAWVDGIPMMVFSGQVRKEIKLTREDIKEGLRRLGEPQEINLLDIVKPITKYTICVENPNEIRYHLEKAYYFAKSGKPGPSWIEIPLDVQCAEIDENNLIGFNVPIKPKYAIPFKEVAEALNKAEKPLMIVGNGVRLAGAINELQKFIEKTGINVVTAMSGTDLIDHNYPNYLGEQGLTGIETANYAADECDLLLIIGTRMQIRQTSFEYKDFTKNAIKIMIDIDKVELYKRTLNIDIPICADAKNFLEGILKEDIKLKRWNVEKKKIEYKENPNYIDVYQFLNEFGGKCDYPIITSNGMVAEVSHQALKLKKGQRLITNTAFGEMGKGLPMAIGACVANNKKPVICFEGDGSIMMNIQELQTMKHHNLPLKIFLFNNGGYYSIRNTHKKYFNRIFAADPGSGVTFPDWSKLAPAWGIEYEQIKDKEDLHKIDRILNYPGPIICELMIDPQQKKLSKWSPKKKNEGYNDKEIQAIIFDFDGVITPSNHVRRKTYFSIFNHIPGSSKSIKKAITEDSKRTRYEIVEATLIKLRDKGLIQFQDLKKETEKYVNEYSRITEKAVSEMSEISGASKSLKSLSKRYILFILTGTTQKSMEVVLKNRNLKRYFSKIYGGFRYKIDGMNLLLKEQTLNPQKLVYVGDGKLDHECAMYHKMPFVAILNETNDFETQKDITWKLNDLKRLPEMVKKIEKTFNKNG